MTKDEKRALTVEAIGAVCFLSIVYALALSQIRATILPMSFQPLGDRVLVEQQAVDSVSQGGIIIPDVGKDIPQQGQVLSVGPGAAAFLKPGDHIMFGKYAGLTITVNHRDLLVMDLSEVLGKIISDQKEDKQNAH